MSDPVSLEFLAHQQQRLLDEMLAMRADLQDLRDARERSRDDVAVLTAMVLRLEGSLAREARSLQARFDLLDRRPTRVEEPSP